MVLRALSLGLLAACEVGAPGLMEGDAGELVDAGEAPDAGGTDAGGGGAGGTGGAGGGAGGVGGFAGGAGGGLVERDAGVDAGLVDAGLVDAGSLGDAGVSVFVLAGKMHRRAISCDDGRTWKNDLSSDDSYRCFSSAAADCDHNEGSSTSLVSNGGVLMRTAGWGAPGTFHRSFDGVNWQQVLSAETVQDVMVGPTRWITATRTARRSDDLGLTWVSSPTIDVSAGSTTIWNIRGGAYGGGSFVVTSQDGSNVDWRYSRDNGATWQRATMDGGGSMSACGAGHLAFGNGVFVFANGATVCRSTDQGRTWAKTTLSQANIESTVLWTGSEFMAWSPGRLHRSSDGAMWTSTTIQLRGSNTVITLGPVARGPTGTFVGVRGGWDVWYDKQRFYRSTDGVTWDELPATAYKKSHPVTHLIHAEVRASSVCP